jgi:lipopolysaccharide export LptBFGC system permease protein LptF
MMLIDRYMFGRFIVNFVILFALLFLFAVAVDIILNLDAFVEAARKISGAQASTLNVVTTLISTTINFQAPRLFQFYAYLHGLVAIGAMGFTLAQMYRNKELVALLATGTSMHRIAMPFIIGMFCLSLIQLINQETMLPKVAPLLLRGHGEIGWEGARDFEVLLMPDGKDSLWHAAKFIPIDGTLIRPTVIERDARGRTQRRITADLATWDDERSAWRLVNGAVIVMPDPDTAGAQRSLSSEPIEFYETDLTPYVLTIRRYNQFAALLSIAQIERLLELNVSDSRSLRRFQYSRFASVLVNVLVMVITLPSFLLREPTSLMNRSMTCAALAIGCMMGAAVFMMADIEAIRPAVSVFLPVIVLFPVALARVTTIHT